MTFFKYLNLTRAYILFLFLAPSIIYTIFLLNGADLPKLSVLASERFWIYLVEHKRAISHGLLTWPGNIDTSVIYIERLLVRFILLPFDSKIYFIIDSLISSILFVGSISFALKRYYKDYIKFEIFVLILLAIQPLYFLKIIYFDINIFELWWSRNLVSTMAFVFFLFGIHELFFKENVTYSLFFASLLGFTHFYSFILFLGCTGIFFIYKILSKEIDILIKGLRKKFIIINALFIGLILFALINTYLMQGSQDIAYFFDRYTPSRNENLYKDLLLHELKYLFPIFFLTVFFLFYLKTLDKVFKKALGLLILVVFTAIIISFIFYFIFPDTINIHFRIYIIEPLLLLIFSLIFFNYFKRFLIPSLVTIFLISLILPYNLINFVSKTLMLENKEIRTVHSYLYSNDISDCQCTIFDPKSHEFLKDLSSELSLEDYELEQWTNALIHKELYFK